MTKTQVPLNQKFYGDYEPDTAADWTLLPGSGSRVYAGSGPDRDPVLFRSIFG